MGRENSRRGFLKRGLAVAGIATVAGGPVVSTRAHSRSNTIEIRSEGGGVAAYEFTVSGSIKQQDGGDEVSGNRASGHLGPDRGRDAFTYSGDITGLSFAGPVTVRRNGYRLRPDVYPAPDGTLTAADFPSGGGTRRLRIESEGGGFGVYEFEVNGSVRQLDRGDQVTGRRAYGHVGPKRGADAFAFTGEVTRFDLLGPASASVDGNAVSPGGGPRSAVAVGPSRTVTARPGTTLLFEALARGYRGDYPSSRWYVDGQRAYGPDRFYGQLGTGSRSAFTNSFESTGTHRVRAELFDEGKAHEEDADPVGVVKWTVKVTPDGNRPPTVTRVKPDADAVTASRHSPEEVEFEASVEDRDSQLDRVIWWIGQCDAVLAVSPVSGTEATARFSYAPEPGCPLVAWAVDEHGALASSDAWLIEAKDG